MLYLNETVAAETPALDRLKAQMEAIAKAARGPVGAAVMLVESGESVALNGRQRFPMQSVYKIPIAMATLHAVEQGRFALDQRIPIPARDIVAAPIHSPIREKYPHGTMSLRVRDLLRYMIVESDGTASDILLRLVKGPEQVTTYLRRLGVKEVIVATTERAMGQSERVQYRNWATPKGALRLLEILHRGKGLSRTSRALLLRWMVETGTGLHRIKGELPAGTVVAHKTGTSGTVGGITRATNDVGLVTLPDGRHLAIAVFVSDTKADEATREAVIAKIARVAYDCWAKQTTTETQGERK